MPIIIKRNGKCVSPVCSRRTENVMIGGESHVSTEISGVESHFDILGLLVKQSNPLNHPIQHLKWDSMIGNTKETPS